MLLKNLIRGKTNTEAIPANANLAKSANVTPIYDANSPNLAEIAKLALATHQNETNNTHSKNIIDLINVACEGLQINPQSVIDRLLSTEDKMDIIDGVIPLACLRAHIANWYFKGMPHISGKDKGS